MGMEVSDDCMHKEPDGVITYENGGLEDSVKKTSSNHDDVVKLHRHTQACVDLCMDQENCEVKQCVEKQSIEMSETCEARSCDEKKAGKILPKEKLNSRISNGSKLTNLLKHASRTSNVNPRPSCTIPQPFALATEKRASYGARTLSSEDDGGATINKLSITLKETQPPSSTKRNQLLSLFVSRKPTQPENKKHPDDDDFISSLLSSTLPTKPKITVASAPAFRSTKRAEKRKEFNSKLEEKHQALEIEKLQSEARTKEEREAAIKQLRKSMIFKASPMPNFYHESSSPRLELKKPPPTCAKSPKIGRRKSCSDADGLEKLKKDSERGSRCSLGMDKDDINMTNTTLMQSGNQTFNCSEEPFNTDKLAPSSINGTQNASIRVQC